MENNTSYPTPYIRVGYAFVPVQKLGEILSPEEGLRKGSIFPELVIPMSEYGPKGDCNDK